MRHSTTPGGAGPRWEETFLKRPQATFKEALAPWEGWSFGRLAQFGQPSFVGTCVPPEGDVGPWVEAAHTADLSGNTEGERRSDGYKMAPPDTLRNSGGASFCVAVCVVGEFVCCSGV